MLLHLTSNQLRYQYVVLSDEKCGRGKGHYTHASQPRSQEPTALQHTALQFSLKISQQPHSNSAPTKCPHASLRSFYWWFKVLCCKMFLWYNLHFSRKGTVYFSQPSYFHNHHHVFVTFSEQIPKSILNPSKQCLQQTSFHDVWNI